ncbi:MAG: hypothetical protein ABJB02_03245 [Dokdonella sp.]
MQWLGWVIAIVAIGFAIVLGRRLASANAHAEDLLYAKIDAENALQADHDSEAAPTANPFRDVVARLDPALESVRENLVKQDAHLIDYRKLVGQFDAAVQYCLQPVELILGADKASLDELVRHVEGARRKLFEARSALEKNPLHVAPIMAISPVDDVQALIDYVRALPAQAATAAAPALAIDDAVIDVAPATAHDDTY